MRNFPINLQGNIPFFAGQLVEKRLLKFNEISKDLLAPGNIYWKQISGVERLISAKSDILNFEMLQKLADSEKTLLIEDSIEFEIHQKIELIFKEYKTEIQLKNKLKWRTEFNELLKTNYYQSEKSQFDLDQLCWRLFSEMDRETGSEYLKRDCDYFKRSMSIASSYVLCAYLIGYYDVAFLTDIYNTTIVSLLDIGSDHVVTPHMKEMLEDIRKKATLSGEDQDFLKTIIDTKVFEQKILFEKFDGSGLMSINVLEMSDLEMVLCSLNYYYQFVHSEKDNILKAIKDGRFPANRKIINLIKRNFEILTEEQQVA